MPSSTPDARPSVWRLVAWPAAITLAVTILRLTGELFKWSPALFSREAGGGAALVGIAWLVPLFGIWFEVKLHRSGEPKPRVLRGLGIVVAAFAIIPACGFAIFRFLGPIGQVSVLCLVSLGSVAIAYFAWPALGRVLIAYGYAARIPVFLIMLAAMFSGWDSHYALGRPDFPPVAPWALWLLTGFLPQTTIWIAYTVVFGMLFGLLSAAVSYRRQA
jgi:hypothetical protein